MLLEESKENLHDLFLVISHPLTIQLNENLNEWMNEWLINALLNECIIELMNEQKIIWMNDWIDINDRWINKINHMNEIKWIHDKHESNTGMNPI